MKKTDWKFVLGSSIWMVTGVIIVGRLINAVTHAEDDAIRVSQAVNVTGIFLLLVSALIYTKRQLVAVAVKTATEERDAVIDRQLWRIRTQDAAMKRFAKAVRRANVTDATEVERRAIASELEFLESLIRTEEHHP